ncbi:ABC-F family ATP-binding cassette domain-containing protein [Yinghuangia seranimata]|uniref:ABC-F family ATP-binding cassette domain-containing protein n=1 Tax=Yinghuangia seranimata TaxID=408067 RepID=UPI00248BDD57|nr:ABC-F family ATP-binding cassette domain-containing protein [Yinghuangia seranimata]MDI2130624.1 ABC-F family ATP-binding cassette domain-containing protein [Yinghuangia seranimata]
MSISTSALSVVCSDLDFAWPDGRAVFTGFQLAVGPGRTGLVGLNGAGKSTLLRLIAGELAPTGGAVRVTGELGYLPQNLTLDVDARVDEILGIAEIRTALHAVEAGSVDEAHFTAVGDDWDVEERAQAALDRLGLGRLDLDRTTGELSGGESVLLALAGQLLRRPDVLLLDEPTNNLDLAARERLYDAVLAWPGVLIVVSHDRELLDLVDQIADLRDGDVRWYGGGFSDYEHALAVEQEAAERMVRVAEGDVRRQERELADAHVKLARRQRYGQKMNAQKREPKIVMGLRKQQAQVSAGKHRTMHTERLAGARDRLTEAERAVHDDDVIRVDLPLTAVPEGRNVLSLPGVRLQYGPRVGLEVRGPERIALVGANGSGKTTLLRTVAGHLEPLTGEVRHGVPLRYLPQRLDLLFDELTVAENIGRFAPTATDNEIRARLARFLFKGRRADQKAETLSGGERFRATLAALLLAEPAPQLLMLDEPTNNLDMASVRQLTTALESYQGALIVASHDVPFLRDIGATRWLRLDEEGLTRIDPM